MRQLPGTRRAKHAPFITTRWSTVIACSQPDGVSDEEAQIALTALCRQYWPPLYSFARRRGYRLPDAQDLTQEFFGYLLEHRLYERADPAKGRFRSFLIAVFKRFLADIGKRETSQKRGGGRGFVLLRSELDYAETQCLYELMDDASPDEEHFFDQQWAETLVRNALANLQQAYASESKAELFASLQGFLTGGEELPTQQELAGRLRMPAATLRSHVTRLRARYRDILRAEVARTVLREKDIDEELHHLCQILLHA